MVLQSLFSDLFVDGVSSVSYEGGVTARIIRPLDGGEVKVGVVGGNFRDFVLNLLHRKGICAGELSFKWFDNAVLLTVA